MPEGFPTLESQVPYYVAVKDQGTEGAEPSVPSRLALRKNHYIESPGGERSSPSDIRTPSNHQEVKPQVRSTSPGTKQYLEPNATCNVLDLLTTYLLFKYTPMIIICIRL